MAEQPPVPRPVDPVPLREPIVERATLTLPPVWARWLEQVRTTQAQMEAQILDLQARVAALEGP